MAMSVVGDPLQLKVFLTGQLASICSMDAPNKGNSHPKQDEGTVRDFITGPEWCTI